MTSPAIVLADQMPFVGHLQQRQIDGGERDAVAVGQLPVDRDAVAGFQPAGFDLPTRSASTRPVQRIFGFWVGVAILFPGTFYSDCYFL